MRKKRKGVDQVNLDEKEIIRLYLEEMLTIQDICKKLGVNYATIKLRLTRNNVPLRSVSESKKIVMNRPEVKQNVSEASKRSSQQRMETNIERYGSTVPSNAPEKREKWQQEYLEEHGIEWNKDPSRMEKSKATCMERYGVDNGSKADEAREKISQHRWKDKTEEELEEIKNKSIQSFYNNNHKERVKSILDFLELEILDEYINGYTKYRYRCKVCNNIFEMRFNSIQFSNCPFCNPRNIERVSKAEKEIIEFLKSLGVHNIVENSKFIISPYELDIYLPDYNLAIEYNGLWFHCEGGPNSSTITERYHLLKTEACQKLNIRLIHIFEDEWIFKNDIVKSRLIHFLNLSKVPKIYARNCIVKEINTQDKNDFLNLFHIQGADSSTIKLGAYYNDELVSVMTFSLGSIAKGSKLKEGVWELSRFCSCSQYNVIGVASKLLEHFKRNYEWFEIFTYADRRWSTGNLYFQLGFKHISTSKPNYWYTKNLERHHRFKFRKKEDEPKDIPEWVLRQAEGYFRIWDCGHLKFELTK